MIFMRMRSQDVAVLLRIFSWGLIGTGLLSLVHALMVLGVDPSHAWEDGVDAFLFLFVGFSAEHLARGPKSARSNGPASWSVMCRASGETRIETMTNFTIRRVDTGYEVISEHRDQVAQAREEARAWELARFFAAEHGGVVLADMCRCVHDSTNRAGRACCESSGDWHVHRFQPCPVHPNTRSGNLFKQA